MVLEVEKPGHGSSKGPCCLNPWQRTEQTGMHRRERKRDVSLVYNRSLEQTPHWPVSQNPLQEEGMNPLHDLVTSQTPYHPTFPRWHQISQAGRTIVITYMSVSHLVFLSSLSLLHSSSTCLLRHLHVKSVYLVI